MLLIKNDENDDLKKLKTENNNSGFFSCDGSDGNARFAQPKASCICLRLYIAMINTMSLSNLGEKGLF